jgi:hypothetical protein
LDLIIPKRSVSRRIVSVAGCDNLTDGDEIRHLERWGCEFLPEGNNHTVYVNRTARKSSSVPRHSEINDFLARKICADLQIPKA